MEELLMVACLLAVTDISLLLDDSMSDYATYFRLATFLRVTPHCIYIYFS